MFSGSWKESAEKAIHIDITDQNINEEGDLLLLKLTK